MKILGAEDVPQSGLGQQPGAVVGVLHVGHAHGGITDPVVDHRVHRHRDTVLGQHLQGVVSGAGVSSVFVLTS